MTHIAFIGAGNIAQAIIGGYLDTFPGEHIITADPMPEQLAKLPSHIETTSDNLVASSQADIVVLCVKPNKMAEACQALSVVAADKLFISVAAGITTLSLKTWLGEQTAIIRCMPNTPALVKQGITGLFANEQVSAQQKNRAEKMLTAVGVVEWFNQESDLDIVTAISGSGPAYYFLVMEAMQAAACELGLSEAVSRRLVLQTALGAAKTALESELSTAQLRTNVTSPGGTTEAALQVLNSADLSTTFLQGINAAYQRSKTLSST